MRNILHHRTPNIVTTLLRATLLRTTLIRTTLLSATLLHGAVNAAERRFVPLDHQGSPIPATALTQWREWPCVLDQRTGLVWEVKSGQPGLHYRHHTYSWFDPDHTRNGGLAGEPGGSSCRGDTQHTECDTLRFTQAVNQEGLCNAHDWRLPTREELRSLVDYRIPYPGPTIDQQAFPNTVAQFYWSANPAATEPAEAWGIGFAHGFDYAYFKSDRVHVRLVRGNHSSGSGVAK